MLRQNKKLAGGFVVFTLLALAGWLIPKPGLTAPLEVYGRLPSLENVAISPDGSLLAVVHTTANDRVLEVSSLSDHKVVGKSLQIGNAKLRWVEWADNDHLLIFSSVTGMPMEFVNRKNEFLRMSIWSISKQLLASYPRVERYSGVTVMNTVRGRVMVRRIEGHTVLFVPGTYVRSMTLPALFRIELDTGDQRLIRQGAMETEGWLVDADGEVVAEADYNQTLQRWAMLGGHGGRLQELASGHEAIDVPDLLGFGSEPDTLLVQTNHDNLQIWRLLSLQNGTFGPPLAERRSMEAPIEDPQTHRMIGGVHEDDSPHYVFFDPRIRGVWGSITDAYADEQVEFVSASADFSKVIVKVTGPIHGYTYNLMDLKTFKAVPIGEVYEGVGTPLEVKRIDYDAADGLKIPAYLTLPRGKPAKNLPLIVFPTADPRCGITPDSTGGPKPWPPRDTSCCSPNYRGSAVTMAGTLGRLRRVGPQDADGFVRRRALSRKGRHGGSGSCLHRRGQLRRLRRAGGRNPGSRRLPLRGLGGRNLRPQAHVAGGESLRGSGAALLGSLHGREGPSDPLLQQLSPIKHVDAITVPVLLIHGRDDSVVRFEQSDLMLDAMKHANKDVEMVTLKNEDHWLSRGETRLADAAVVGGLPACPQPAGLSGAVSRDRDMLRQNKKHCGQGRHLRVAGAGRIALDARGRQRRWKFTGACRASRRWRCHRMARESP